MKILSIVIPAYKSTPVLLNLIKDIVLYNRQNLLEIIIINDGICSDILNQLNGLKEYKFLKIVNNKKNIGQHLSTLKGLKMAKGNIIATLDDDYRHNPKYIKPMINILKKKN